MHIEQKTLDALTVVFCVCACWLLWRAPSDSSTMLPSAVFERLHYHLNTNLGRARAHLSSGAPLPFTLLTSSISKLSKKIIQKNIYFLI